MPVNLDYCGVGLLYLYTLYTEEELNTVLTDLVQVCLTSLSRWHLQLAGFNVSGRATTHKNRFRNNFLTYLHCGLLIAIPLLVTRQTRVGDGTIVDSFCHWSIYLVMFSLI